MKKKGFTLVELLAVIAILAILVIIALPNIMSMFNTAKKNVFLNEVKIVHKAAEQAYISDKLNNENTYIYVKSEDNTKCSRDLDIKSNSVYYYVEMYKNGNIRKLYVKDNTYQYKLEKDVIDIMDIKLEDVEELGDDTQEFHISCNQISQSPTNPNNPVNPNLPTYTITYDANGGDGVPSEQIKTHDEELTLSTTVPTRSGFTFIEWNTSLDGNGTGYLAGSTYRNNESVTLYAKWGVTSIVCYRPFDKCGGDFPYGYGNSGCAKAVRRAYSPNADGTCNNGDRNKEGMCCPAYATYITGGYCHQVINYFVDCTEGTKSGGRCMKTFNQSECPNGWTPN